MANDVPPVLQKRLYVVLWINAPDATREQHAAVFPQHVAFLLDLEERGILFASGPFRPPEGQRADYNGMTILRAADVADAQSILAREPFVSHGLRTYKLLPWDLNEGSFSVRLRFGTGTYEVP